MQSDVDGSWQYGRIMKKQDAAKSRILEENAAGASSKFTVEVIKHDSREIVMQMSFANPDAISSGNQNDVVRMEVLEVSLFQTANLQKMDMSSFKDGEAKIEKIVPPIISD
jgi:hypothetical protein